MAPKRTSSKSPSQAGGERIPSPVERWRSAVPELPPLTLASSSVAEALLLHLHYAVDFSDDSWIAGHLHRYWNEILPGRVRNAAYRSSTLDRFWSLTTTTSALPIRPLPEERRLEVASLLRAPAPAAVIAVLRFELPALILRVQIIADAVGRARAADQARRSKTEASVR